MSKSPEPKKLTKKHIAKFEKDQKQRRTILITTAVIAAAIVFVILFGILDQTVFKANRPVATVNGEAIKTKDFVSRVKLQRVSYNSQAMQYYQLSQYFGDFSQYIQQIQYLLDDEVTFANNTLEALINEIVYQDYADANGITVTDEEVEKELHTQFGFYPEGTPTPENTATPYATSTMSPEQYQVITATPLPQPTDVPVVEETEAVETTEEAVTPTEAATEEATAEPEVEEPTEEPTPVPTATVYTQELFDEDWKDAVTNYQNDYGITENDLISSIYSQLLYQKVYDAVTANIETEEEQVWARHILVATEEEANAVLDRLANGEDWDVIAAEVSTDTSNKDQGGDLSWFGRNVMDPAFEEAAYALTEIGEISQPVNSSFGWHIIQLLGKEVRPIAASQLSTNKDTMFSDWLTAEKENYDIQIFDDRVAEVAPTEPAFNTALLSQ